MTGEHRFVASVLIPTHNHASTLDLAVASALDQTAQPVEVIIIGDGVTEQVRALARQLVAQDERVVFLDLPKADYHGESYRDLAIRSARSPAICYLCDDDLLLPDHVESMLELLADHDLAQSLNTWVDADGELRPYPSDLDSPEFVEHLRRFRRNSVSLTGTAHTVAFYLALPVGWENTPPGWEPDHYMWTKFWAVPGVRAATAGRLTALQLPTHQADRATWTGADRRAELLAWRDLAADRATLDRLALAGTYREAARLWRAEREQQKQLAALNRKLDSTNRKLDSTTARLRQTRLELRSERAALRRLRGSRTWRLRERLVGNVFVRRIRSRSWRKRA